MSVVRHDNRLNSETARQRSNNTASVLSGSFLHTSVIPNSLTCPLCSYIQNILLRYAVKHNLTIVAQDLNNLYDYKNLSPILRPFEISWLDLGPRRTPWHEKWKAGNKDVYDLSLFHVKWNNAPFRYEKKWVAWLDSD